MDGSCGVCLRMWNDCMVGGVVEMVWIGFVFCFGELMGVRSMMWWLVGICRWREWGVLVSVGINYICYVGVVGVGVFIFRKVGVWYVFILLLEFGVVCELFWVGFFVFEFFCCILKCCD